MTTSITTEILAKLQQFNQKQLIHWWDDLDSSQREELACQIESIDFEQIERLLAHHRGDATHEESPREKAFRAEPPADLIRFPKTETEKSAWGKAAHQGEGILAAGKVGVILVAGGQGTRLGFDKPKGMYPIGPVSGNSLFQMLVEQAIARSRRAGVIIPYYVMTSDATHEETVDYFTEQKYFGLDPADVYFFKQGAMPAVDDQSGQLLLDEKGNVATSPDGHGGMLAALFHAGLLNDMKQRGVEYLYYHQVDNPTAIVCDPAFLGFHVQHESEMSSKVVAKRTPEEKMGVVVDVDGQTQIIEYSDFPDEIARKTDAGGRLLLDAGSTAIHIFNREFLERLVSDDKGLPFHVAHKKVPFLDENGKRIEPEKPNAYKFERFIFDAMPAAQHALVVETDRSREFKPVKNAEGDDSPETCRAALTAIAVDMLQEAGVKVAEGVAVEISPLFALDGGDVQRKMESGTVISESRFLHEG